MLALKLPFLIAIAIAQLSGTAQNATPPNNLTAHDISQLQSKAVAGDAESQVMLGRAYEGGNGIAKNSEQAFKWFHEAADKGNAEAEDRVGTMLRLGEGVDKDKEEAVVWYRKAARQGNSLAMFNLATCFYNGDGVRIDDSLALTWFLLAEDAGDTHAKEAAERMESEGHPDRRADAFLEVAKMYKIGDEIPRDYTKAVASYRRAVDVGSPQANVELASTLVKGQGVSQNLPEALKLCEDAAGKKYGPGAFCVGVIYQDGLGVSKDPAESAKWFEKAAQLGHPQAMCNIGEMYWKGIGVKVDRQTAYMWILLASSASIPKATQELPELKNEMSPKDVEKATKKAILWQQTHSPQLILRKSSTSSQ